jgi:taurine transport system substrate-binding protein
MKSAFWIATALALGLGVASAQAQEKTVTIVHQDMVVPFRVLIDSKKLEEATGYTIEWRKIPGGGDVIRAMASGDAQIGEVGSSPAAAAVSSGIDVQVFWILDDIADAEQLVAREGSDINSVADLKGKKIGVPFVSTTHYQLLFALQDAGLSQGDAEVLNMAPPAIAAAWERGDIDATFVWDPVLSQVKKNGKVLVSAGELAKKGRPTFDAIVVDRTWAQENKEFMTTLVKMIAEQDEQFRQTKDKWTADSAEVQSVAKISGADPASVPNAINAYKFLTLEEQASETWLGGGANSGVAKALADTAAFLKEQGRITEVADDYSQFVTDEFVKAARQ